MPFRILPLITAFITTAPVAAEVTNNGCDDVIAAMEDGIDRNQIIDRLTLTLADQMARTPEISEFEDEHPGFAMAMAKAMRPVIASYSLRISDETRPRAIAKCAEVFSPAEAQDVAAFYRSPIGRRVLSGLSANYDGRNSLADALKSKDEQVSAKAIQADRDAMTQRTVGSLSREDLNTMGRMTMEKPALKKLPQFDNALAQNQVDAESVPMNAQEEAALKNALLPLIKRWRAGSAK